MNLSELVFCGDAGEPGENMVVNKLAELLFILGTWVIANEFMEAEINKKDVPYNEKKLVDRYLWYSLNALVSVGFFFFLRTKMNYYEDI